MPQFERRLYEPSDDMRAFDASEDDPEEEGSRLPLLIVIALVVLASFAGVVWLAYTQGVQRGRESAPRIIAAQPSQKTAGAEKNPYAGLNIYKPAKPGGEDVDRQTVPPAPPPVAPRSATATPKVAPVVKPPASATKPAASIAKSLPAPVQNAGKAAGLKPSALAQNKMVPAAKMVKPAPATLPTETSTRLATAAPRIITPPAGLKPAPALPHMKSMSSAPKSTPTKTTPIPTSSGPAVTKPTTQTAALNLPVAAKTPPHPEKATQAADAGGFVLQIGSYKSEAEATASWQTYKTAHPAVAGYSSDIHRAELGAKGTWYRLRVGPFESLSEANAACARLKASGGNCFPAKR